MLIQQLSNILLQVLGLVLFFGTAIVAIFFRDQDIVRKGFIVVFIFLLVAPNLGLPIRWPFMYWGLFASDGPTENMGYEWRVVNSNGEELRYDNQAAEPVLVLERYGPQILSQEEEYATKLGNHLLAEAREYQDVVEEGDSSHPWWAFPEHQIRPHWSQQEAENFGRIKALRLYCTHTVIAKNGSAIISQDENLAAQINDSSTYVNRSVC